jgi:hypothetical protein
VLRYGDLDKKIACADIGGKFARWIVTSGNRGVRIAFTSICCSNDIIYRQRQNQFSMGGWGNTGCGSGGLFPTVLEDIWDGESERTDEGVFEKPFDDAYWIVESPN